MRRRPLKYFPVIDSGFSATSAAVPCATIRAAVRAGSGPEVHDIVGLPDRILVVLDDDDGIAEIAQVDQRVEQALIVALMQADGGLVQDVHDADQPRADLAREADALRLAARERVGAAVEGEIAEPDVREEAQPIADLLDDLHGDLAAPARKLQRLEERHRPGDRERGDLGQALRLDEHVACGAVEPGAAAFGAGPRRAVLGELLAHRGRFGLAVAAFEILDDAFEGMSALDGAALAVEILEFDLLVVAAEQDQVS